MEGSSNALLTASAYLNASNTNVSNFVTVKLSGSRNYLLWKAQMLRLLKSINACGILDGAFVEPRDCDPETVAQYDNLIGGWIFGTVTEDVLVDVYNLGSAKAVWEKLQSRYNPPERSPEDDSGEQRVVENNQSDYGSSVTHVHNENQSFFTRLEPNSIKIQNQDSITTAEQERFDTNSETQTKNEEGRVEVIVPTETQAENEDTEKSKMKSTRMVQLRAATIKGEWPEVEAILKEDGGLVAEAISSSDGSTILHIAIGIGHNDFVKNLFSYMDENQVLQKRVSDGSTALHIASIVGNKDGAELLVKKNINLLRITDNEGKEPLHKAYENMHLDTIGYLLKEAGDIGYPGEEQKVQLLVNAISAKQYSLALQFVHMFPGSASERDDVLMAIAKTFPTGPHMWERLVYPPSLHSLNKDAKEVADLFIFTIRIPYDIWFAEEEDKARKENKGAGCWSILAYLLTFLIFLLLLWPFLLIMVLLIIIAYIAFSYLPDLLLFSVWWFCIMIRVPTVKLIDNKMKEWDEAKKVLTLVCNEIDKLKYTNTPHPCYTRPILEAACQNAYEVVNVILSRFPEVIECKDKNGYDIIQLAIINRSEKIYNLIYDIGERKNLYRTYKDSSENNILHLAGKLAPPSVLNKRTGAALQLQRELQWREEVKKFVFPSYITRENIFKETPDMLFTREHKDLVKEGEQWIKTAAESCSITAALITTIVFAAAITVPGGSNQENGTPLFKKRTAFLIFAISDAISLFASSTALLVFLSILTARFAERDFLDSLPRRLFIGLFSLLLSTTAMMVAYSATLFLVFSNEKQWVLAPICGLAFIPISFFVGLQFPLMVDLFSSTYIGVFGKKRKSFFNKDEIRLRFGNNLAPAMQAKQLRRVLTRT